MRCALNGLHHVTSRFIHWTDKSQQNLTLSTHSHTFRFDHGSRWIRRVTPVMLTLHYHVKPRMHITIATAEGLRHTAPHARAAADTQRARCRRCAAARHRNTPLRPHTRTQTATPSIAALTRQRLLACCSTAHTHTYTHTHSRALSRVAHPPATHARPQTYVVAPQTRAGRSVRRRHISCCRQQQQPHAAAPVTPSAAPVKPHLAAHRPAKGRCGSRSCHAAAAPAHTGGDAQWACCGALAAGHCGPARGRPDGHRVASWL
jgi:hypothetical protein